MKVRRGAAAIKALFTRSSLCWSIFMHHPRARWITKDIDYQSRLDQDADILPNTIEVYIGYLAQTRSIGPFPKNRPCCKLYAVFAL